MHKKLMVACMAIASIAACVVAPVASASPVLTESGVALPAGTSVTGKNTGTFNYTVGYLNLECSAVEMAGTVTENTGTSFKITIPAVTGVTITGTGAGGDCTSLLGSIKWTYTSELCLANVPKTDNVTITGCGTNPVTITQEFTGTGPCKYSTTTMTGTYVTNAGATVNLLDQRILGEATNGTFCPTEGKLDMDLDFYTTGGSTQLAIS